MKYEVKKEFIDKHSKEYFSEGSVYETENTERADELAKAGFISEEVMTKTEAEQAEEAALEERLNHVGGGYFELPNGEKVRGRENAIEVLKKLDNGDEKA
ncbi:hypothetical protein J31TS4_19230 [Paenibacillus sp. J31TS4]|uniref:hypothetical protein n=1 Tax=Paenibacillus sp. J31TS4 TaxID=2807195 RepID=UPI001AFE71A4|nr:hypothetical protein [Paenibacillus sp. J31TS4]GIP38643.1 hypothetical protein J31TS4_19230 [Paenibacillus sp. J31TS4]